MPAYIYVCIYICVRGNPKIPGTVKKNLFTIFVQVWKFCPLQSTSPVTGCNNPSAAPTAGNNAKNLQWKCCQGPLAISHWTSATSTKHFPFKSRFTCRYKTKSQGARLGEWGLWWYKATFCFCQKLLDAQGCVGEGIVMEQEPIPTLPLLWTFSSQALMQSFHHIQVKLLIYCLS